MGKKLVTLEILVWTLFAIGVLAYFAVLGWLIYIVVWFLWYHIGSFNDALIAVLLLLTIGVSGVMPGSASPKKRMKKEKDEKEKEAD